MSPAIPRLDLHNVAMPPSTTSKITSPGSEQYGGTGNVITGPGDDFHVSQAPKEHTDAWLLAKKPFKIPISGVAMLTEHGLDQTCCNLLATMGARQTGRLIG
jgi:hypothetical protein